LYITQVRNREDEGNFDDAPWSVASSGWPPVGRSSCIPNMKFPVFYTAD
jgi:hypothetical protein